MKFLDCVMKCYRGVQRTIKDELSVLAAEVQGKTAEAARFPAPFLKLLASTAKPAGIAVEGSGKALVPSKIPVNTKPAGIAVEGFGNWFSCPRRSRSIPQLVMHLFSWVVSQMRDGRC